MFICGSSSFRDDDDVKSPKQRSKRSTSFHRHAEKNPYADRGLDKFYALLADLDDKKQKIYMENGSEDISFVRFVYTHDSDRVKPIVVRVKDKNKLLENGGKVNFVKAFGKPLSNDGDHTKDETTVPSKEESSAEKKGCPISESTLKVEEYLRKPRPPHYYLVVMMLLIMVFLAFFGRSFTVVCMSVGWYLVPSIDRRISPSSSSKNERKKGYVKKLSKKKSGNTYREGSSSPKSVLNGLTD